METRGERWHRESQRHTTRDGLLLAASLLAGWMLITAVGCASCFDRVGEDSHAASERIPEMAVDASDELAHQHRPHEIEAVEAGKLDAEGNPIDGEKAVVARLREYVQQRRDRADAVTAEAQQDDVSYEVYAEDGCQYQDEYSWGARDISQVKMATTTSELLGGDGVHRDESGNTYTWYPNDIGNGSIEGRIPGCHYDDSGVAYDQDGYIAVAADGHEYGEVIDTPYGDAKVYDFGSGYGNVDIYTNK